MDMQSLRQILLDLPNVGAATKRAVAANYTRFVTKGMAKAEMVIKVVDRCDFFIRDGAVFGFLNRVGAQAVMTPHEVATTFVDDFIRVRGPLGEFLPHTFAPLPLCPSQLMGVEESLSALIKVLEMKGLKKADQQPIIERFKKVNPKAVDVALPTSAAGGASAAAAPVPAPSSAATPAAGAAAALAAAPAPTGPAGAAVAATDSAAAAAASPVAAPAKPSFKSRFSLPTKPTMKLEQLLKRFQ
jgi:hypothetical protein